MWNMASAQCCIYFLIMTATVIYATGACSIWVWGFRGCEGNEYRAVNPDKTWKAVGDAISRITNRFYDDVHEVFKKSK